MKKLICLFILLSFIYFSKPSYAVTKCHKDVCVGQEVLIINGLYKDNLAKIWDILKVEQPDDDAEQIKDTYKYFAYTYDGYTLELYREDLITGNYK